ARQDRTAPRLSFDTSGGTVRIKAGIAHVASYTSGGAVAGGNPHGGLIGVTSGGDAEGTDIIIPALRLSYTVTMAAGSVTESFAKQMARMTGRVNNDSFRTFSPGELLFLGASGEGSGSAESDIAFQFAASENADNLTIGEIAGIVKAGHDHAWIEYADAAVEFDGETVPGQEAKAVHIERIYHQASFAAA